MLLLLTNRLLQQLLKTNEIFAITNTNQTINLIKQIHSYQIYTFIDLPSEVFHTVGCVTE